MRSAKATDPCELERHILDPNIGKTEAEHWAKDRIEELADQLSRKFQENNTLKAELASIDRALNDARLNLTHTAVQVILELKQKASSL